ncbi:RNA pyrophosphohydrolase [Rhizobium rhizogenes]|uniref:RNA pyrophosphohydrolase n=1 Tax=Rhizobium rhizogenes TaxID=359 RepID=A0AAN2DDF4_RHIRH|nr:NUDIX domain-containing protein [Rhizobium rhizogenes]NSZ79708.1 NUDIX domain-containing protein [Agrobacterium tumefaciens]AQS61130.1 NUDIX domain-containing protein [Rhizobium rhizogenes]MCZ7443876.1 NUDIX domain-containing protein [Rhizobium rhizogenes]OAM63838.1 DNA mismatch repair protein MutT [Rhizobium rhizogenes]CAD0212585.1 RNA pyrophosphohydrolase [Rhizobium rhizogenes]
MNDETTGQKARPFHMRVFIRFLHFIFLLTRGATLGVRAACFDEKGRIFLVRHTYLPGWYLPGGGVERGETLLMALHKEIREEGNLVAASTPQLFHVYLNLEGSNRDHVALYRLEVSQTAPKKPDHEIAESGFFDLSALPEGVTAATRRRLAELAGETEIADHW